MGEEDETGRNHVLSAPGICGSGLVPCLVAHPGWGCGEVWLWCLGFAGSTKPPQCLALGLTWILPGGGYGITWEICYCLKCLVPGACYLPISLERPAGQGLLIAISLEGKLRPHFKSVAKPFVLHPYICQTVPFCHLLSVPQPRLQLPHVICLPSPWTIHSLSAARGIFAQQKSDLITPLPKRFMASQCLRIKAKPGLATCLFSASPPAPHMRPAGS